MEVALDPPDSLCRSRQELLTTLIVKHLIRLLRVASHIFVLDAASFAIQVLGPIFRASFCWMLCRLAVQMCWPCGFVCCMLL